MKEKYKKKQKNVLQNYKMKKKIFLKKSRNQRANNMHQKNLQKQKQNYWKMLECCDTLVNGVPYADVNNAHKILAGLDIINTLIKFYNTSAPIFIDNRESINEIYKIDTQIISLIVTTDSKLRIEVSK